jgi:hypothetical protein
MENSMIIFLEVLLMKPSIFILGIEHFSDQYNGDLFMTDKEDMLSKIRQNEIYELVTCLKKYEPTKIALEVLQENEEALNYHYVSFTKGDYSLTVNEVDQIGFRLAKECGHKKVYAVDWNKNQDDIPDLDLGVWTETYEYKAFTEIAQDIMSKSNTYLQKHSIKVFLHWLNDSQNVLRGQEMYMKLALVGSQSNPVGAMWTAKYWYYRNMLIYKNLVSLIDSNEERIFVLYGAGHLHLLLQFIKESGLFNVKVASDYLG